MFLFSHDEEVRRELSSTLALWRLDPLVCRDPSELLLEASREVPLAVVVDTCMDGMDPLGVVRSLREHPTTREVIAIAILDHLRDDAVELAAAAGCDRMTARPVDPDWIGGEIERIAARRPGRAA